jgi:hypothetical protein
MVKHNVRIFAFAILGLAFIIYGIIFLITQNLDSIDFNQAISHVSTTISINIVIWMIFIAWMWKWSIFYPWLVSFPNLSGEWTGNIKSNWKEKALDPIPINLTITQTFFNIQVKIKTAESRSYSVSSSFDIDSDRGFQQLFYSYLNIPKSGVRERSEIHYGSTVLNFEGFTVRKMEGEYWTDRETTGEIEVIKKERANIMT